MSARAHGGQPAGRSQTRRWRALLASERDAAALYEREIAVEAEELRSHPQEERDELVLLYRAKGMDRTEAQRIADTIMADQQVALDTLSREELGLDPGQLGSPVTAALSSLVTFAAGAFVALFPYLISGGAAAFGAAIGLAVVALFAVGAGIGALNGRSAVRSGLRQIVVGGLAAMVTFGIGRLIGVSVS